VLFILTSPDLDKVNCTDFQIIFLFVFFLNSSKGLWRRTPFRNSPFGDTRISAAAAGWVDLVLSHSIYHCSYHWLSFSNDPELIWGQTARRHTNNTLYVQKHGNYHIMISHTLWQTRLWLTKSSFHYRPTGPRTHYINKLGPLQYPLILLKH